MSESWLKSDMHDLRYAYRTKNKELVLKLTAKHDRLFNVKRSKEFYKEIENWLVKDR